MPGEILGLDAINDSVYVSSAKTLETTAICEIPFSEIDALSHEIHNLQKHMYRLLSKEIRDDQELQLLLGKKTAEAKVGTFLMNMALRFEQRKLSASHFRLPMPRSDIGNYLGLAVETVSRIFTRLQELSIIKADGKNIEVLNRGELCKLAHLTSG